MQEAHVREWNIHIDTFIKDTCYDNSYNIFTHVISLLDLYFNFIF